MNRTDSGYEKLWTRPFAVILLATVTVTLVTNMFNLGMTYYADLIHGGMEFAGVSAGVFSLASFFSKPFAATIANKFDEGKIMVVTALLIAVAAYSHVFVDTIPWLVVARLIHGVLFGIYATAAGAAANAILPRSRLSEGLGFVSVTSMLVPAAGPTLFLAIVQEGDLSSFNGLFVISVIICVATALFVFFGMPVFGARDVLGKAKKNVADKIEKEAGASYEPEKPLPRTYFGFELKTLLPTALLCLFCTAFSSVNFFLPEYAFASDIGDIGPVYIIFASVSLACRFLVGKKSDARGPDRYICWGILCLALSYIAIPLCPSAVYLYIVAIPLGIGMGLVAPFLNYYIVRRCTTARPGSASAAYYAAYDIGFTIGAVSAGLVISSWGYTALYIACGVLCIGGFILFRLLLAGDDYTA